MSLELSAPKLSQKLLDQGFEARLLSVPCPFFDFPLRMRQLHNAPLLCFVLQTVTMNDWDNKKDRGTQLYIEPLHNSTRSATASICTSKHCNSSAIVIIYCKRLCDDDDNRKSRAHAARAHQSLQTCTVTTAPAAPLAWPTPDESLHRRVMQQLRK